MKKTLLLSAWLVIAGGLVLAAGPAAAQVECEDTLLETCDGSVPPLFEPPAGGEIPEGLELCTPAFQCGGNPVNCEGDGNCFCMELFEQPGTGFCADLTDPSCGQQCDNGTGDCPPGFACAINSCCQVPTCIPHCTFIPVQLMGFTIEIDTCAD